MGYFEDGKISMKESNNTSYEEASSKQNVLSDGVHKLDVRMIKAEEEFLAAPQRGRI